MNKINTEETYNTIRASAKKNLVNFIRLFLSNDNGTYKEPAKFHYDMSDILLNSKDNFAVQAFRGGGKSTMVGQAYLLHALTFPAPERKFICIVRATQDDADNALRNVKEIYKTTPVLKLELDDIKRDTASCFHIKTKSGDEVMIKTFGKGGSIRGQNEVIGGVPTRPSIVLMDDIQDTDTADSETQLKRDYDRFRTDIENLDKDVRLFMIGNNLGDKCLIEIIMQNADVFGFQTLRLPVIDDEGNSTWRGKWSVEEIEKKKDSYRQMGDLSKFYREYMCVAMADEDRTFKKDYFRYFDDNDIKDKNLIYTTTVDLAISEKESADNTVVMTVGKDKLSPNWYIMEYTAGRLTPMQTVDAIFMHYEKYRSVKVGIEMVAYQKAMLYMVQEEMRKRQCFPVIEELKAKHAKEIRIKGLQPMYATGTIFHRKHYTDLEDELITFPRGRHDDKIDCLAYQKDLIQPTKSHSKNNIVAINPVNYLTGKRVL